MPEWGGCHVGVRCLCLLRIFEPPVTGSALSSDHWPVCFPSCLVMFQESILMFELNPPCWVFISMTGSKF